MAKRKRYDPRTSPPDEILLAGTGTLRNGKVVFPPWTRAESLAPDIRTMDDFVRGDERSIAIIVSWAFHFPVTVMELES